MSNKKTKNKNHSVMSSSMPMTSFNYHKANPRAYNRHTRIINVMRPAMPMTSSNYRKANPSAYNGGRRSHKKSKRSRRTRSKRSKKN